MAKQREIFLKRRLAPGQLRAVAELRADDAQALLDTGQKARTNGAIYLAGFVIECLLKALLLERHPNLRVPVDSARLSGGDRDVLKLLYSHDLDCMLGFLPEVRLRLESITDAAGRPCWPAFRDICAQWTVYARYATTQASITDAQRFMNTIREVKQWLREP